MRKALIVGIDDYKNGRKLNGAVNDAKEMAKVLSYNADGTPNFSCKLLVSSEMEVTRKDLRRKLFDLSEHDANFALLYFSGHGYTNKLGSYLITQEAEAYDEGVSFEEVLKLANNSTIPEILIILDCCHSGSMGSYNFAGEEYTMLKKGVSILTSCATNQYAFEKNGHGLFTNVVLQALRGGASDILGQIFITDVFNFSNKYFGAWDQRPILKSHFSRMSCLRKSKPRIERALIKNLATYFDEENNTIELDDTEVATVEMKSFIASNLIIPNEENESDTEGKKSFSLSIQGEYFRELISKGKM